MFIFSEDKFYFNSVRAQRVYKNNVFTRARINVGAERSNMENPTAGRLVITHRSIPTTNRDNTTTIKNIT
jgi:hypothetical protein